jgi:hypothetical protein
MSGGEAAHAPGLAAFRASLAGDAPPEGLGAPLAALWWDAKGNWARAHEAAQAGGDPDSAWVHAYLHRREGDLANARYWYGRAGRPAAAGALDDEWAKIAAAMLSR